MPWLGPIRPLTMKRRSVSGNEREGLVELVAIGLQVIEVGVLRRLGQREEDALVFLGGELGLACSCT